MVEPAGADGKEVSSAATESAGSAPAATAQGLSLPDFWHRIQHHKVMHWTLAYAAAGYTLLHGVEMLSNSLSWPHLVARIVTLVLLIGLPVVITLAWYHGEKGLQKVSGPELVIITVLLTIGGSILWVFARGADHGTEATGSAAASSVALVSDKSIAVLPFVNLSSSADDEYLSDGLADTLLQMLTQVPDLKVIARTSSFSFKGKNEDVRSIAQKLGVATILEGSVQRSGDRLRVIAQLVSARDGTHLWSRTYDRMLTDVFAVQDEIATQVSTALSASLQDTAKSQYTPSVEAYQEYLRGKQLLAQSTETARAAARSHFQNAVDRDPAYALAYVGLAETYGSLGEMGASLLFQVESDRDRANSAVQQALKLDGSLGEAYAALGNIRRTINDDVGAEQAYRKAIELNPGYAPSYQRFGIHLFQGTDRFSEAEQLLDRAAALDPLLPNVHLGKSAVTRAQGRLDESLRHANRAIELAPEVGGYIAGAMTWTARGRLDAAVWYMKRAQQSATYGVASPLVVARLYDYLGGKVEAERIRRDFVGDRAASPDGLLQLALLAWDRRDLEAAGKMSRDYLQRYRDATGAAQMLSVRADIDSGHAAAGLATIKAHMPELFGPSPAITTLNRNFVPLLARAQRDSGQDQWQPQLLEAAERFVRSLPGYADRYTNFVPWRTLLLPRVLVLQGKHQEALKELRAGVDSGDGYDWQYWSVDPVFAPIRDTPEFKQCVEIVKARNAKQLEAVRRQTDQPPA